MELVIKMNGKMFYSLVVIIVLLVVSIGVYAFTTDGSGNPSVMGHSLDEIGVPSGCSNGEVLKVGLDGENPVWVCDSGAVLPVCGSGQILKVVDGVWKCGSDTDTNTDTHGAITTTEVNGPSVTSGCAHSFPDSLVKTVLEGGCPKGTSFTRFEVTTSSRCTTNNEHRYTAHCVCTQYAVS